MGCVDIHGHHHTYYPVNPNNLYFIPEKPGEHKKKNKNKKKTREHEKPVI